MPTHPGWYGKLPALGDFARRRLDAGFVEAWDRWLASELDAWQRTDEGWLDRYLAAPVSCFVLGAGLLGAAHPGGAGVLMPSVDRVGRYFPLTVVLPRTPGADVPSQAWFAALEGAAVAAMLDDWDAERLDRALAELPDPQDEPTSLEWPLRGESLWWRGSGAVHAAPRPGLPAAATFVALFASPSVDGDSGDTPIDPLQIFDP